MEPSVQHGCRRLRRHLLQSPPPGGTDKEQITVIPDDNSSSKASVWSTINARSFQLFLYDHDVDVCCVTETWFSNNVPNSLICFNGYRVFRRDRGTYGGGDNIHSEMVEIPTRFNNVEIICVDLMFNDIDYRVICLYRKPGFSAADVDYIKECVKCL